MKRGELDLQVSNCKSVISYVDGSKMDIVHRLHYLVLSQKSDLMTMEREQRLRVRRQSSLPEYSKANKSRQKLEQAYFNDVSFLALTTLVLDG